MDNMQKIVKPMERGQITIPQEFRDAYNITPDTFLWIKTFNDYQILIEPVPQRKGRSSLASFLKKNRNNKNVYWTKEDDATLARIRRNDAKRLKELTRW